MYVLLERGEWKGCVVMELLGGLDAEGYKKLKRSDLAFTLRD